MDCPLHGQLLTVRQVGSTSKRQSHCRELRRGLHARHWAVKAANRIFVLPHARSRMRRLIKGSFEHLHEIDVRILLIGGLCGA